MSPNMNRVFQLGAAGRARDTKESDNLLTHMAEGPQSWYFDCVCVREGQSMEVAERIHWLGHDAFRIDGDKIIYIDPYQILPGRPADLILITHDHFDHCSPDDVAKIQTPDTVIVTEPSAAKKLNGKVRTMKPGDELDIEGIHIEAVPAYNTNKNFHPQKNNWLGFIIEVEGTRIYHAGDTDLIDEMRDFDVDIALLPVSGTYVMTADEAVEAVERLKPELVIPMHYGTVVGSEDDAKLFAQALQGKTKVLILQPQKPASA